MTRRWETSSPARCMRSGAAALDREELQNGSNKTRRRYRRRCGRGSAVASNRALSWYDASVTPSWATSWRCDARHQPTSRWPTSRSLVARLPVSDARSTSGPPAPGLGCWAGAAHPRRSRSCGSGPGRGAALPDLAEPCGRSDPASVGAQYLPKAQLGETREEMGVSNQRIVKLQEDWDNPPAAAQAAFATYDKAHRIAQASLADVDSGRSTLALDMLIGQVLPLTDDLVGQLRGICSTGPGLSGRPTRSSVATSRPPSWVPPSTTSSARSAPRSTSSSAWRAWRTC